MAHSGAGDCGAPAEAAVVAPQQQGEQTEQQLLHGSHEIDTEVERLLNPPELAEEGVDEAGLLSDDPPDSDGERDAAWQEHAGAAALHEGPAGQRELLLVHGVRTLLRLCWLPLRGLTVLSHSLKHAMWLIGVQLPLGDGKRSCTRNTCVTRIRVPAQPSSRRRNCAMLHYPLRRYL